MGWATAHTISLFGATGHLIDVQVDLAQGVVATALVGRPDASVVVLVFNNWSPSTFQSMATITWRAESMYVVVVRCP